MTTCPVFSVNDEVLERVRTNLAYLHRRIRSVGRDPESVRVVAVTKAFTTAEVRAALTLGLNTLGENYVNELCAKRRATNDARARWHYLGALQSNKIARALECADVLCAVSRERELERVAALSPSTALYVQVDFTGGEGRNGVTPAALGALVTRARALGLEVRGVMVVAPRGHDAAREAFRRTRSLADEWDLVERSMGMSDDVELACEFGSTEVRVGRALFGNRVSAGHLA